MRISSKLVIIIHVMIKVEMIVDRIIEAEIEDRIAGHVGAHVESHVVNPEADLEDIGVRIAVGTIMLIMRDPKVPEIIKHQIGATEGLVVGTITLMIDRKVQEIKTLDKMTDQPLIDLRVAVRTVVAGLVGHVVPVVVAAVEETTF